jgi:DNA-binding transcriptional MocR family regulator
LARIHAARQRAQRSARFPRKLSGLLAVRSTHHLHCEMIWRCTASYACGCIASALNLGQGFPNWETPLFVKQALCDAVMANHNQYCRSNGHPVLVEQLAKEYSAAFGRPVSAMNDVVITYGATEALYAVAHALIEPGDEAVIVEPAYDSYPAVVAVSIVELAPFRVLALIDGLNHRSLLVVCRVLYLCVSRMRLLQTPVVCPVETVGLHSKSRSVFSPCPREIRNRLC